MFKVKTDFGFVLVEKEKIAAIIPTVSTDAASAKVDGAKVGTPAGKTLEAGKPESLATKKTEAVKAESSAANKPDAVKAQVAPAKNGEVAESEVPAVKRPETNNAGIPPVKKGEGKKSGAQKLSSDQPADFNVAVSTSNSSHAAGPASNTAAAVAPPNKNAVEISHAAAPAPQPVEPPVNREAVEGNSYVNYTYGFRMYKAPSWRVIDDARQTIPNAVVAMGTADESTLMVVAEVKSKKALQPAAAEVENRLRETYGNYRRISQRTTVAGGFPAVEIRYRGIADEHDWSGTLMVVARSSDMLSILGMTYAMTDLIQIQENVIARAIASLEFTAR
jgi:hypothetical protein